MHCHWPKASCLQKQIYLKKASIASLKWSPSRQRQEEIAEGRLADSSSLHIEATLYWQRTPSKQKTIPVIWFLLAAFKAKPFCESPEGWVVPTCSIRRQCSRWLQDYTALRVKNRDASRIAQSPASSSRKWLFHEELWISYVQNPSGMGKLSLERTRK